MTDLVIKDLFSKEQVESLKEFFSDLKRTRPMVSAEDADIQQLHTFEYVINNKSLGKIIIDITGSDIPEDIVKTIQDKVPSEWGIGKPLSLAYTEYAVAYGKPELVMHRDRADNLLVDYQLESNTQWPLQLDEDKRLVTLSDNDALVFEPYNQLHGRPEKQFKGDEFVTMLFFYFVYNGNKEEYKNL
jgi:hypothetical protein